MLKKFAYKRAASVKEAIDLAAKPGASILAGGTDLLGCLRDGVFETAQVVSLSGLKELRGIAAQPGGGLRIGALTTLTEIAENKEIRQKYRVLAEAALSAASPQLRNQGTLGGNLCQRPRCWYFRGDFHCLRKGGDACFAEAGESHYHCIFGGGPCFIVHPSDTAPALVALDAKFRVVGPKGARTVPAGAFFVAPKENVTKETVLAPGEVLTEILLSPPAPGTRGTYNKQRERGAWDFALSGAAVVVETAGGKVGKARVVLAGVAPVPWRSAAAEKALEGRALNEETFEAVAEAAVEGAKPLDENVYKVMLTKGAVKQALRTLAG